MRVLEYSGIFMHYVLFESDGNGLMCYCQCWRYTFSLVMSALVDLITAAFVGAGQRIEESRWELVLMSLRSIH
jgi:hypothetical protein